MIRYGEFNTFTVKTTGTGFDCYLNGTFVSHGEDRKYGRVETVVTRDESTLFVKLLNNSDRDEEVEILSDLPFAEAYEWATVTGDPTAMNSLDQPENIHAVHGKDICAGGKLTRTVPAWSFTVLRLALQ